MKKRLMAIIFSLVMLFSCIPAIALNLETAEASEFTASESISSLQAISEDDALLYQPADNYGNLIGSISFDNQNAERDALSFAPALPSMETVGVTLSYVEDPLGERDGYVAKATIKGTNRIALSVYNSEDLASLGTGRYTLAMDVYTTSSTAKLGTCRVDVNEAKEGSHINDDIYNARGAWNTVTVGFEITEVNGDEVTVVVDDAAYTEPSVMSSRPTVQIWMINSAETYVYLDDVRLYYYPENSAAWIDHMGNRVMLDTSEMTTFPAPSDIIEYSDDSEFYAWADEDGTLYKAGTEASVDTLKYKTFTGVAKSYVYFENGDESAEISELEEVPYPSEVNSDWSDAGFYAWIDDEGNYRYPGDAATIYDLADYTLTAVTTADYNATLPTMKMDGNGVILLHEDFENFGTDSLGIWQAYNWAYADSHYVSASNIKGIAAGTFTIVDEAGRGKVMKAVNTHRLLNDSTLTSGKGTYKVVADVNSTFSTVRFDLGAQYQHVSVTKNTWATKSYSITGTGADVTSISIWASETGAAGTLYVDNIYLYYMPENAVVFDNADGSQAIYYGDANGNIVITAPSGVNANWSDNGFGGWTATNGSVYSVGDTVAVADLAGQVLKNEVAKTYFKLGDETASKVDVSVIPYPSEVNSEWSDAGFYAWELDGVKYLPGTAGSSALSEKTLTAVMTADYNATLPTMKMDGNGVILLHEDFENFGTDSLGIWQAYNWAYADSHYVSASNIKGIAAGTFTIVDEAGRGKVMKAVNTHRLLNDSTLTSGKGTYKVVADVNSTFSTVRFDLGAQYQHVSVTKNTWATKSYSITGTGADITSFSIWASETGAAGTLYVDNIYLYYMPENAVVFDNGEAQSLYYGDANGKIKLPAPSGVNKNWSDEDFGSWKLSDGTLYNIGDELDVADLAGKKIELVKDNDFAPIMLNKSSLRLTGVNGMRFASFVSMDARENAVEYGYIVSRKAFFADVDYDYNTNFVMPAGFDTENTQGTLDTIDMPFLCGIAYKPSINKDVIYTTDGSVFGDDVNYGDGIYYTCVLTGMEGYDQYHETMVVRTFIKIGENYFYGTTMEKSLYDVALAYQQANGVGANAFVDGIVSATAE